VDTDASNGFESGTNWIQNWLTFLTLFSNFVPLSLYVSLEVITFLLMFFISRDVNLYHPDTDTPAIARSSAVSDLGMVKYIFSDKTGTITQNIMKLRRLGASGQIFGERVLKATNEGDEDELGLSALTHRARFDEEMLLRVMALCHTVVVERTNDVADDANDTEISASPPGLAYQAESPDEAALVNSASLDFGVRLLGNEDGCTVIESDVATGLFGVVWNGEDGCGGGGDLTEALQSLVNSNLAVSVQAAVTKRVEKWKVLAVNKFDSTRKRMSVLLRAPDELGGFIVLLCKGADSSMICPGVAVGGDWLLRGSSKTNSPSKDGVFGTSIDLAYLNTLLELQQIISEFALDGLRTLVFGVRVLSSQQAGDWMTVHGEAARVVGPTREERLREAAGAIEKDLRIIGASGVEDKLQDGVPETISSLRAAGIKVIVLTGDKLETAVEIGHATCLLTPEMQVTQFDDSMDADEVKRAVASEFIRLVKSGRLRNFGSSSLKRSECNPILCVKNFFLTTILGRPRLFTDQEKRRETRNCASIFLAPEAACEDSSSSSGSIEQGLRLGERAKDQVDLVEDEHSEQFQPRTRILSVFRRGKSAKQFAAALRTYANNNSTADSASVVTIPNSAVFNQSSRRSTRMERYFSADKAVRHGGLAKHHAADIGSEEGKEPSTQIGIKRGLGADDDEEDEENCAGHAHEDDDTPAAAAAEDAGAGALLVDQQLSAVVITGRALSFILGDAHLEDMIFNIFSCQDSVIACRVSPKQKALVVRLAKTLVKPRPVTLAIGDGANDVGMIQEAQVGVGISGLEGRQAVNAADFAVAQFSFLGDLLLVHGRWNYIRLSKVCMYSFYKNAVLVLTMFFFQIFSHWSGRSQYEDYVTSMFNFILGAQIIFAGIFDRDITKDYARTQPNAYVVGRENQDLSRRVIFRWSILSVVHAAVLYFFSQFVYSNGTSGSAAETLPYVGHFADGSGGGLACYGTTMFTIMIAVLAVKVLLETRSWLVGQCAGGLWDRVPYTLVGIVVFLVGLMAFFFGIYEQEAFATWSTVQGFFYLVPFHVFVPRPVIFLQIIVVLAACTMLDISFKLVAFYFFPSQTLIHQEISELERRDKVERGLWRRRAGEAEEGGGEEEVSTTFCCGCEDFFGCFASMKNLNDGEDDGEDDDEGGGGGGGGGVNDGNII
jgi:magnesium-transporting ATPase (P-type)